MVTWSVPAFLSYYVRIGVGAGTGAENYTRNFEKINIYRTYSNFRCKPDLKILKIYKAKVYRNTVRNQTVICNGGLVSQLKDT